MSPEEEYNKHIKETYCSYETCQVLKQLGFNEVCDCMYGMGIFHNGKYLDFDEECELKAEGRGDEIEYVPGGWVYGHTSSRNSDPWCKAKQSCAMPTYDQAVRWMRKTYNVHIYVMRRRKQWHWGMQDINADNTEFLISDNDYPEYEDAIDAGIRTEAKKQLIRKKNADKRNYSK